MAHSEKIKTIHQCLVYILECLILKQAEILQKQIKGKVTSKLSILRKRHRAVLVNWKSGGEEFEVTPIGSSTFLVCSFEDDEIDNYTVRKNERKTCSSDHENAVCHVLCTSCSICYHEFCCSCQDYSIKNNMCKHIHWLGLWLQNNRVLLGDEEMESIAADGTSTNSVAENEVDMTVTVGENSSIYWREKVTPKLPHWPLIYRLCLQNNWR